MPSNTVDGPKNGAVFKSDTPGRSGQSLSALAGELGADDLERLAVSAYLLGRNAESDDAWALAHRRYSDEGDVGGAIRCAFWLGFRLVNALERSEANAWIARLERLVTASPDDSLARARLDYLTGLRAAFEGGLGTATEHLENAAAIATRRGDEELAALARLSLGRVRIFLGQITLGVRLLDDAMLVVASEPISPIAVGDSYCTAIDACHDLHDVRRGQAWTDALSRWCGKQPDLVPFAGVCQVHRAEFLQLKGAWVEAMAQAGLARERLTRPFRQLAYGAAAYQQGELHRLLGEIRQGRGVLPGRQRRRSRPTARAGVAAPTPGRADDAAQAIDRAMSEAGDPVRRVCAPSGKRRDHACRSTAWLRRRRLRLSLSSSRPPSSPRCSPPQPLAPQAGSGWPRTMLAARSSDLRRASDGFRELDAPYEVACTALLIGTARAALG